MNDVRYWMAEPGATPEGPYDLDTLRRMREQGRIGPTTQVCPDGGTSWQPASNVLGGSGEASPPPAGASWSNAGGGGGMGAGGFGSAVAGRAPVGLAAAITATVLGALFSPCFSGLVLGIIAIVQVSGANEALRRGNVAEFDQKAGVAKTCTTIAFVLIGIGCILNAGLFMLMIASGGFP